MKTELQLRELARRSYEDFYHKVRADISFDDWLRAWRKGYESAPQQPDAMNPPPAAERPTEKPEDTCPTYSLQDARMWRALMRMAGAWENGSQRMVILTQDDATRECGVKIQKGWDPKKKDYDFASFWAGSFESAMAQAIQAGEDRDDY